MSDVQITISILIGIIFFLYLINNLISLSNVELYLKKYNELQRGVYKYEPTPGLQSHYFYLYNYDIDTLTFTKTDVAIIFFIDGAIKLTENNYIHYWQIWWSLPIWYHYRKFHKLKDIIIKEHNINAEFRRRARVLDDYRRQYGGTTTKEADFKFFRG